MCGTQKDFVWWFFFFLFLFDIQNSEWNVQSLPVGELLKTWGNRNGIKNWKGRGQLRGWEVVVMLMVSLWSVGLNKFSGSLVLTFLFGQEYVQLYYLIQDLVNYFWAHIVWSKLWQATQRTETGNLRLDAFFQEGSYQVKRKDIFSQINLNNETCNCISEYVVKTMYSAIQLELI